jgi:DNA-binding transcriptional LysR family regulator
LAPLLTQFQNQYPEITLELILTDSILNLIEGAIDIAIRIGTFKDSSLIARKLGENQLVLCASPSYLKKHPQIRTESDLKLHALLYLDSHGDSRFIKSGTKISDLAKQSKIQCSDGLTLTEFAVHGNGIALRSTWDVQSLIQSGKLKPVLEQEPLEPAGEIMLIVPSRRYLSPRVRALMDFISEKKVFKT